MILKDSSPDINFIKISLSPTLIISSTSSFKLLFIIIPALFLFLFFFYIPKLIAILLTFFVINPLYPLSLLQVAMLTLLIVSTILINFPINDPISRLLGVSYFQN